MRLNDDVAVLALPIERGGQTTVLNLSLILDEHNGPTLVDAGLPGQAQAIAAALAGEGVDLAGLRQIIITHQDIDHIGSLAELVRTSEARVLAGATEAPTIDGTTPPRFARPEILDQRPELRAAAAQFQPTAVDDLLHDNQRLDLAGGTLVIDTPGHTPGHVSLYLQRSKTLITGDAMTAKDGRLNGPNPSATMDMARATASVQKLAGLDVTTIICYHGGVVSEDAHGQLERVARELAAP